MKSSLIAQGNTYCGKSGLPRTVKDVSRVRWGRMYINYSRPDGTEGGCFIEAFMSWATGFHNPETPAMTPTRALIEAAEAILIPMEKEIMEGGGIFSDTQFETLRAAISSAKAAEEGVETDPKV